MYNILAQSFRHFFVAKTKLNVDKDSIKHINVDIKDKHTTCRTDPAHSNV